MDKTNIFLLLPETEPQNQWANRNEAFRTEKRLNELIIEVLRYEQIVKIENRLFFYDGKNIINFLQHFQPPQKNYPQPYIRRLKSFLKDKEDWREDAKQSERKVYLIFKQPIDDHTFCEIAERKISDTKSEYILLNIRACKIKEEIIKVTVNNFKVLIPNIKNEKELKSWFAANRIPKRKFYKNPKHGKKEKCGSPKISPLLCSEKKAQLLLNKAVGERIEELFNYDARFDKVIVFKSENWDAVYHGFHIDKNSQEIPNKIKKLLKIKKIK